MKETEKGICLGALKKFIRKLEHQIKIQKKELDLYKKKVVEFKRKSKYYDRAIGKEGAVVFSDVPEVLGCGMSPELLMEILKNADLFNSDGIADVHYVEGGFFAVLEQRYFLGENVYTVVDNIVYPKGLRRIRRVLAYRGIRCRNVRGI